MKKIIIILTLVFVLTLCWGEDKCMSSDEISWIGIDYGIVLSEMSYHFGKGDTVSITINGQKIRTNENVYVIAPIIRLLQFYDEYEKECYADSTQVGVLVFRYMEEDDYGSGCELYETRRDHREPTLKGFIKFLRRIK